MGSISNIIGGMEVPSGSKRTAPIYNPATGEQSAELALSTSAELDAAVSAAKLALPEWANMPPLKRARFMFRFKELLDANVDRIAEAISKEHGKTHADAVGEVTRGIEVVEFCCGIPHLLKGEFSRHVGPAIDTHSDRQPLGVCAGITPFNFPAMVPMWMYPVAIACGNTFVLKPSEKDPSTSMVIYDLFRQTGFPDGVLNIVHGDKEVVDAILTHPDIKAVSFVGSTPIAEYVYQTGTANGKRVQALGGA
ncbi:MAG: aldehyde dehydrogenase family protein, partial [Alphaproteobacteria bacterium]